MFSNMFTRFTRMLNRNKNDLGKQNQNIHARQNSQDLQQFENFEEQLKKIKEQSNSTPKGVVTQEKKRIFKIEEDLETPGGTVAEEDYVNNPYNVTMEEEYISSDDDDHQHRKTAK